MSTAPLEFNIGLTHAYDPNTIDPGDLTVNGQAAAGVILADALTITFQFNTTPIVTEGPQVMEISQHGLAPPMKRVMTMEP